MRAGPMFIYLRFAFAAIYWEEGGVVVCGWWQTGVVPCVEQAGKKHRMHFYLQLELGVAAASHRSLCIVIDVLAAVASPCEDCVSKNEMLSSPNGPYVALMTCSVLYLSLFCSPPPPPPPFCFVLCVS